MIDLVDRLRFDAIRSEVQFSKGVAGNITEAADEIERLRAQIASARKALEPFAKISLWTDRYPDGPRMLTDSRLRGRVMYENILAARSALTDENGK